MEHVQESPDDAQRVFTLTQITQQENMVCPIIFPYIIYFLGSELS